MADNKSIKVEAKVTIEIKDGEVFIDSTPVKYWVKHLENAVADSPEGLLCEHCGGVNTFFDDIGFFCFIKEEDADKEHPELFIGCEKCWNGADGRAHIERYGLGER